MKIASGEIAFMLDDHNMCSFSCEAPLDVCPKLRETTQGKVIGFVESANNAYAWLGIPYAQPPIGDFRWKAPRPVKPWKGVKKVLTYGPRCIQSKPIWKDNVLACNNFSGTTYIGSEDCLYLNIWCPVAHTEAGKENRQSLPVMFWVHGGGNVSGHGEVNGGEFASSQNVVLVSLNYRLGHFGWLSHQSIRDLAANNEDASGNFGTLDIIAGLEWVQKNIAAFGGDPSRVTLFGLSAGAWNVYSLLVSPRAKGLFHRAIAQSGWPLSFDGSYAENFQDDLLPGHPQSSNEMLLCLLQLDGVVSNRTAAKTHLERMTSTEVQIYLKDKSYQEIDHAYTVLAKEFSDSSAPLTQTVPESNSSVPKIFRDGCVVSEYPFLDVVKARKHNAVPIILGCTKDESKLFQLLSCDSYIQLNNNRRLIQDISRYSLINKYISFLWKLVGVDEPAETLVENQTQPVFVYRFDWDDLPNESGEDLKMIFGACHGADSDFIFGPAENLVFSDVTVPASFRWLSDCIRAYWSSFAYCGQPGRGSKEQEAEWPARTPAVLSSPLAGEMIVFNSKDKGGVYVMSEVLTREDVLDEIKNDLASFNKSVRDQFYIDIKQHPIQLVSDYFLNEEG